MSEALPPAGAPPSAASWYEENRRYLLASIDRVRQALARSSAPAAEGAPVAPPVLPPAGLCPPPALDVLCGAFALTPFERDVLLLCAGVELDDEFAARCAALVGERARPHPTFGLAMTALPDGHWDATTPVAPLRRLRLIELLPGETLTTSPLRIEERVLHYLVGISYLDERLARCTAPVSPPEEMPPSHHELVAQIVALEQADKLSPPIIQLCHAAEADRDAAWGIAAAAARALGQKLQVLRISEAPADTSEREAIVSLWERELRLGAGALLIAYEEEETARAAFALAERLPGLRFLAGTEPGRAPTATIVRLDVQRPTKSEQRQLWQRHLGPLAATLNGQLDTLVSQFSLSSPGIRAASVRSVRSAATDRPLAGALWETCRTQLRAAMVGLAQRIEPATSWDDLILPAAQHDILREIAVHVRHRAKVCDTWGFAAKSARGLGVSALFSGASGTGKTMAAEILARELALDLYRIDLSQVVSKYIGETEKNLRRLFDRAEQGGAILLFDEADALFGKRSEVKDSHDRYANIEVSYLLSRMEVYRGLSILTTNQKSALDPAFLRRIRFFVSFPFPELSERTEIWRRAFPPDTPTQDLDPQKLARLNLAGGNIRNIALTAAFLAADSGEPVQMKHLLQAASRECAKLDRSVSAAEIGGWV